MSNLSSVFNSLRWARPQAPSPVARPVVGAADPPTEIVVALAQMELLVTGDRPRLTRMPSSPLAAVYRGELAWGTVCIKRALRGPGLDADPAAALARSAHETRFLRLAREVVSGSTPEIIAEHPGAGIFVMEYLDPDRYPAWVKVLEGERIEPWIAAEIGHLLGRLHAASASSPAVLQRFPSASSFRALCIEPRLQNALAAHADCADALSGLLEGLEQTRLALVHGSFSPDNVLVGPRGPVVVDADCAAYADPAFDFSTMLADLLMWMTRRPQKLADYRACFDTFTRTYLPHVTWEMTSQAEARAARLVPALLMGALDGERASTRVIDSATEARDAARALILSPVERLQEVQAAWIAAIAPATGRSAVKTQP